MADTTFKLNRAGSIALVTIDNGEDYHVPTTLGRSAFDSAVAVLQELERGDWSAAVFTGKPLVFCVGADIDEFGRIEDPREGIRAGHELFARIRALPFPTVAAINGACLGGGLELALHCDARTIAANVRHVGFPEVALSIIPGWGGTQLLPRLVGPEVAARVIVLNPLRQNRLLEAEEAVELGIADRLLEPVEFVDESLAFASSLSIEREAPDWSELDTVARRRRARVDSQRREALPRDDRRRRHRLGAVRRLRPRARGGVRAARGETRGLRRGEKGRSGRDPRNEHVVAVGGGDGRRHRPA